MLNVFTVILETDPNAFTNVGIFFTEFGHVLCMVRVLEHAQEIMKHKDLRSFPISNL
jgi:hypothetical protein